MSNIYLNFDCCSRYDNVNSPGLVGDEILHDIGFKGQLVMNGDENAKSIISVC